MSDHDHVSGCTKCRAWNEEDTVKDLCIRLNRIEGQIRGIKRMIEEGVYCDDVLVQLASVQSALCSVARLLLEQHMKSCVIKQLEQGDKQVIDELLQTVFKLL